MTVKKKSPLKIKGNILELGAWKIRGHGPFEIMRQPPEKHIQNMSMEPGEVKDLRLSQFWTGDQMASTIGLNSGRAIREYEAGAHSVPQPMQMLLWYIENYGLPAAK